jgi:hypothetical protein
VTQRGRNGCFAIPHGSDRFRPEPARTACTSQRSGPPWTHLVRRDPNDLAMRMRGLEPPRGPEAGGGGCRRVVGTGQPRGSTRVVRHGSATRRRTFAPVMHPALPAGGCVATTSSPTANAARPAALDTLLAASASVYEPPAVTWEEVTAVSTLAFAAVTAWLAQSTRRLAREASAETRANWQPVLVPDVDAESGTGVAIVGLSLEDRLLSLRTERGSRTRAHGDRRPMG